MHIETHAFWIPDDLKVFPVTECECYIYIYLQNSFAEMSGANPLTLSTALKS